MNTATTLIASVALAFAAVGSAVAQEAGSDAWMNAASTKSRAQVQAELAQARADGSIKAVSAGYIETLKPAATAALTRAEVVATVKAARASGELDRIDAEAWNFDGQRQAPAPATRMARAAR
jgi:hypothetical protein